jgi:short-subunit dehydrogenase
MRYRTALITGATSGIGDAIARALPAACGLLLTGRNAERLAALSKTLGGDGRRVEWIAADLATAAGRAAVTDWAKAAEIDFLVNNAGLGRFGAVADNPPAVEAEMVAVNVMAPVEITRALLPGMIERARAAGGRAGVMILSSVVAFQAVPYMTTYAATKAFDLFYAEGLAEELKREPVDVLAVCPGTTRTEFFDRAAMPTRAMPYMLDPDKVARMALAAMGRRTVVVTDPVRRITLAPGLIRRGLVRAATGVVMRRMAR